MLRQRDLFWSSVSFEIEYFLNEETEVILTDTRKNFHDWHLGYLSSNLMLRWDIPLKNMDFFSALVHFLTHYLSLFFVYVYMDVCHYHYHMAQKSVAH